MCAEGLMPCLECLAQEFGATEEEDAKLGTSDFASKYFTCGKLYVDEVRR